MMKAVGGSVKILRAQDSTGGRRADGPPVTASSGYSALTFSARGPFGPWPIVKVTVCPSRS